MGRWVGCGWLMLVVAGCGWLWLVGVGWCWLGLVGFGWCWMVLDGVGWLVGGFRERERRLGPQSLSLPIRSMADYASMKHASSSYLRSSASLPKMVKHRLACFLMFPHGFFQMPYHALPTCFPFVRTKRATVQCRPFRSHACSTAMLPGVEGRLGRSMRWRGEQVEGRAVPTRSDPPTAADGKPG